MKKIKLFLNLFLAVSLLVSMLTVSSCNVSEPSNNNSPSTENSSSQQSNISESSQSPEELGWKESEKHDGIMYNNTAKASDLITKTYPEDKIAYLKDHLNDGEKMTYDHFSSIFNVQCLRKTDQGYYAVLMQDDGKRAFFFIDDELQLKKYSTIVIDQFKTKKEFEAFLSDKNNHFESKIREFDPNSSESIWSMFHATSHIIQEGAFLICYDYPIVGQNQQPPLEELTIEFFPNEDLHKENDAYLLTDLPHILEIDKINP